MRKEIIRIPSTTRVINHAFYLTCVALLAVSGCEYAEDHDSEENDIEFQHSALRGGHVVTGHVGVVDFFLSAGESTVTESATCTGSMIAPDVVLTASHCFDSIGAETTTNGTHDFTIRYYDPNRGVRIVFSGAATWSRHPSYRGIHGTDGAGDANSDMAVIQISGRFTNTDYRDYLRIYSDYGSRLEDYGVTLYGAGRYTYSNKTDNKLRKHWFEVENAEYNHIVLDNTKSVCTCKGDSGGPFIYSTSDIPTIAAVLSNGEILGSEPDVCTNNDPPFDDSFACRTNWKHMQWVQNATGISCVLFTGANRDYRRCFDIPFIEDAKLEGTYSKNVAVALTMSII